MTRCECVDPCEQWKDHTSCANCGRKLTDEERVRRLWQKELGGTDAGFLAGLHALLKDVRADEREACARELEAEQDRVADEEGIMLSESVMFAVCAAHIRGHRAPKRSLIVDVTMRSESEGQKP